MNTVTFQRGLFALGKQERHAVLNTLARIFQMEWATVYEVSGLNWEAVKTQTGPQGEKLYSLRITQKMRMLCFWRGDTLFCLSVHPDHDSAYSR